MANTEIATLGGGCFWCLEAVYREVEGVSSAVSGYMGGKSSNPSYREVCSGSSGHVEVVQVTFDPDVISFREILEIFFVIHDATTLNRQGNDVGTQYRSVIFYHSPEQKTVAEGIVEPPMVTAIEPAATFWEAEDYHQDYLANNPNQPYCAFVVEPKVQKFRKTFAARRRKAS
jgi:peptide-methionine (S)-S-oxide reductase